MSEQDYEKWKRLRLRWDVGMRARHGEFTGEIYMLDWVEHTAVLVAEGKRHKAPIDQLRSA